MMCFLGPLGVGKTHAMVNHAYKNFYKQDCMVISNFYTSMSSCIEQDKENFLDLIQELIEFRAAKFFPVDLNPRFKNSKIAVLIDELIIFFENGSRKSNEEINQLMIDARKMDIHIFTTAQDVHKIHKDLRTFIKEYIKIKPLLPLTWRVKIKDVSRLGNECYHRETRYFLPISRMLKYEIPANDPIFHEDYFKGSQLYLSGYLNRAIYKLYDSNEAVQLERNQTNSFPLLSKIKDIETRAPLITDITKFQNATNN